MRIIDLVATWLNESNLNIEVETSNIDGQIYVYRKHPYSASQLYRYIASIADHSPYGQPRIFIWNGGHKPRIDVGLDYNKPDFFDSLKTTIELCLSAAANDPEWYAFKDEMARLS